MLDLKRTQRLIELYLENKLKDRYTADLIATLDLSSLTLAIQFYHELCGEYLNLAAIASPDAETRALHKGQEAVLFDLLDKSVKLSEEREGFKLGVFDKNAARNLWMEKKSGINFTSLRALHAQTQNLGIAEKFLKGSLHGQEWLTELDLSRLLEAAQVKDQVTITRLNAADIGMALYFHRKKQEALADQNVYRIPFLLNKGSAGDVSSQGSHWTQATVVVNPATRKIDILFKDSLPLSNLEKERIRKSFEAAVNYDELSVVDNVTQRFKAFPGYTIEVQAESANIQGDSWSCGYRALKNLVDDSLFNDVSNAVINKIKAISGANLTSANLRDCCYEALLGSVKLTAEGMNASSREKDIFVESGEKEVQIKPAFLADYLSHVKNIKPNQRQKELSATELKELQEIEKLAKNYEQQFEGYVREGLKEATDEEDKEAESEDEILVLDLAKIFEKEEGSLINKAKIKALIKTLALRHELASVKFIGLNKIPEADYFVKEFEALTTIKSLAMEKEPAQLVKQLEVNVLRNKLLYLLKIESPAGEEPWLELWRKRFSGGATDIDIRGMQGILALDSEDVKKGKEINACVTLVGRRYLDELFRFISLNKKFFESRGKDFPFFTLSLGGEFATYKSPKMQPEDYARLNSEYLDSLIDHLQSGKYFPFKNIILYLNHYRQEDFDKLKKLIELASLYPTLDRISLNHLESTDFSTEQYRELKDLCEAGKLTTLLDFDNISHREEEKYEAYIQLQNTITNNRRRAAIEKRKSGLPSGSDGEELELLPQKSRTTVKVRPYKTQGYQVRSHLALEVNLEQQVDQQQQQQMQTQLEQEVQQELQVAEQQQNEISSFSGTFTDSGVIGRDEYLPNHEYDGAIISGMHFQSPNLRKKMHGVDDKTQIFWNNALGGQGLPQSIKYFTRTALGKIHSLPQFFWSGFNIDNLPMGFFVQQYQDSLVLCYDETQYIENKNSSPLTLELKPNTNATLGDNAIGWRGDLRTLVPKAKEMNYKGSHIARFAGIHYNKYFYPGQATPKKFDEFMMAQDEVLAKKIKEKHAWCLHFPEGSQEIDTSEEQESNYFATDHNLNALIDILYVEGCPGVMVFLDALKQLYDSDPTLYLHFKKSFMGGKDSYRELLEPASLELIKKLASLSRAEKEWWKQLVDQHITAVTQIDLTELFNGFQHFLSRLPKGLSLPIPCPVECSGSMLLTMDRILSILGKVKPRNLRDQLDNLQGLNWGQEGVWYAARWDGFHYFHSAMKLSPDSLDRPFEQKVLGKMNPSYNTTFDDLRKVALNNEIDSLDYPITLFHRFVGGCERIQEKYDYYLGLLDGLKEADFSVSLKTKVLALLAKATTGERGSEPLDPQPLFQFIKENAADIEPILIAVVKVIDKWEVKPNLQELAALLKLMKEQNAVVAAADQVEEEGGEKDVLAILTPRFSKATWQAIYLWGSNRQPLPGQDFLKLYQAFERMDPDNIGLLAKIAAFIRPPYVTAQVDPLVQALTQLKAQANYPDILKVLASLNLKETDPERLPGLLGLTQALNQIKDVYESRQIFPKVTQALPGCIFERAAEMESASLNWTASMLEEVAELNEMLKGYELEPLDIEELKKPVQDWTYIANLLQKVREKAIEKIGFGGELAWEAAKDVTVYPKLIKGLRGVLFADLSLILDQFPALQALQRKEFFPEPTLSGRYFSIADDFKQLSKYVANEGELFEILNDLRKKWPDLTLDFLLNSPRTQEFNLEQLRRLLLTFKAIESSYLPIDLMKKVFSSQALGGLTADKREELVERTIYILGLTEFTLGQRGELVDIVSKARDPQVAEDLVKCLRTIKDQHSEVLAPCFKLFSDYFKVKSDKGIIRQVKAMLSYFGPGDEPVKKLIFERLADNQPLFQRLLTLLPPEGATYPLAKQHFLKVVAYSCLAREEDFKLFSEQKGLLEKLNQLLQERPEFFSELMKLYEQKPYPSFNKLNEFLKISLSGNKANVDSYRAVQDEVLEYIPRYELDPPGLRPQNLDSQFDYATIHTRIDEMRDLLRSSQPLFSSQRKALLERFIYVNDVGRKFDLLIPGDLANKSSYQKPVKDLKRSELQILIQHYRKYLSGGIKGETLELAQLEFIALAREAMYRATGKFPYSTQILSLLNVMLQGGNIFSEIRTGEGKGCITALFAAAKWMEGGAVDVCSSNLELAGRDLEEFKGFFEYLGIKTTLIRAQTKAEDYQQDGINYSDVSELALFQERMQLEHEKLPEKVSCILDEADYIALDNTTQFRYATSLDASFDPHLNPHEWAYPLILEFVQRKEFKEKACDKKEDIEDLRQFIYQHTHATKTEKSKFTNFSDTQLDKWIDSAYIASQLVEDEDFAVRESTIVRDGQNIPVQVARVKVNDRVSLGSSFSNGVHQFLHARLNSELKTGKKSGAKFPIEPEKTYLASKSAKNFIDYYTARGSVLGLTGTVGSAAEIQEMHKNFGFKFFKIPPHKTLLRKDHSPVLASRGRKGVLWLKAETAEEAHFRHILQYIKACQNRGQPALVICDGVKSSKRLHDFLEQALSASNRQNLQLYNGEQLNLREKDVVEKAGLPGSVTISTAMLGRGTDIKPHYVDGSPIRDGLCVIDTFIAPDRDYGQKIGRAGRNGAQGDTHLIVSEAEFQKYQMRIPRNKEELKLAVERIRLRLNEENGKERQERQYFADLKEQYFNTYIQASRSVKEVLTKAFIAQGGNYKDAWKSVGHQGHLLWERFLNQLDSKWNELLIELRNEMKAKPNVDEKTVLLGKFKQLVQFADTEWDATRLELERVSNEGIFNALKKLKQSEPARASIAQPTSSRQLEEKEEQQAAPLSLENISLQEKEPLSAEQVKIPPFKAKPFLAPPPAFKEAIPTYTNYEILDKETINEAKVYVDRVKGQKPSEKMEALLKEIDIVYAKLFQTRKLDEVYQKLFSRRPDALLREEAKKFEVCLEYILQGFHKAASENYDGLSKNHLLGLNQQLLKALGKYAIDDSLKQKVYEIYKNHIQAHKDEGAYVLALRNEMHKAREWGALERTADLSHQGIFAMDEHASWKEVYRYALKELEGYRSSWFKASDRKRKLEALVSDVERLDHDPSLPDSMQKISKLIQLMNTVSLSVAETDRDSDQKLGKWNLFSHRNAGGGRFQDVLSKIHDKATAYLITQARVDLDYKNELRYLTEMLHLLKERTRLVKVSEEPVLSQIANDRVLAALITSLKTADRADFMKNIALVADRLQVYKAALDSLNNSKDSILAFRHFFTDIQEKLYKFKQIEEQRELSQKDDHQAVYNSHEGQLRERIQAAIRFLVSNDHITRSGVDLSRYDHFVTKPGKADHFLRGVLFEMERCLHLQFPEALLIEMKEVVYDPATLELKVKFELQDKKGESQAVDVALTSLGREAASNQFVSCQWPLLTKLPLPSAENTAAMTKEEREARALLQSHKQTPAALEANDKWHARKPRKRVAKKSEGQKLLSLQQRVGLAQRRAKLTYALNKSAEVGRSSGKPRSQAATGSIRKTKLK